jgi:hypothetical protein
MMQAIITFLVIMTGWLRARSAHTCAANELRVRVTGMRGYPGSRISEFWKIDETISH